MKSMLNCIENSKKSKYIVLGVAFDWGKRKGLDVFKELAKVLNKEHYQIVLVGTNIEVDSELPENIISVHKTHDQKELAEYYSIADVFVIPTREENFPTVSIEALACGTPVVTYDTGGSAEIVSERTGVVVPCDDFIALEQAIIHICESHCFASQDCVMRANQYNQESRFLDYVQLYEQIGGGNRV